MIVPGGGQSDTWHQLTYKGKYAGDVRVELTFYDSRPKDEAIVEKKRQRKKTGSTISDATSTTSGPRQMGPREVRRRPLPPGPGATAQSVVPFPTTDKPSLPTARYTISNQPPFHQEGSAPDPLPLQPYAEQHQQSRLPQSMLQDDYEGRMAQISQYLPQPSQNYSYDSPPQEDDYMQEQVDYQQSEVQHAYYPSQRQQSLGQLEQAHMPPENYDLSTLPDQRRGTELPVQSPIHQQRQMGMHEQPAYQRVAYGQPQTTEAWNVTPPLTPQKHELYSPVSPHDQLGPARPSPLAVTPEMALQQARPQRNSMSPTKTAVFRDSPLRHSVSQHDFPPNPNMYSTSQDPFDEPPPPPPAHRNSGSRTIPSSSYSPNAVASAPLRERISRTAVDERSPLQSLERRYETSPQQPPGQMVIRRPQSYAAYQPSVSDPQDDYQELDYDPRDTYKDRGMPQQITPVNNQARQYQAPTTQDRHSLPARRSTYDEPRRAQDNPYPLMTSSSGMQEQVHRSKPAVYKSQAVSPHQIPRKSVSPHPSSDYQHDLRRPSGGVPFGPDSYEALNPGPSPVENALYNSPSGGLEAARQGEVEKLRDQGPIIGNDGRVIDPSDHLPADTWAPEPERKNRKPEHVIRFRTKDEIRSNRTGSSPVTRPLPSPTHSSPAAVPPVSQSRLQKQMPTRPLPLQTYAHSSPTVPTDRSVHEQRRGSYQEESSYSYSPVRGVDRPALSEYQMPAQSGHSPRGAAYQAPPPNLPKQLMPSYDSRQYDGYENYANGYEDSLAAEMSTIDIGPARNNARTFVRPGRGYGM